MAALRPLQATALLPVHRSKGTALLPATLPQQDLRHRPATSLLPGSRPHPRLRVLPRGSLRRPVASPLRALLPVQRRLRAASHRHHLQEEEGSPADGPRPALREPPVGLLLRRPRPVLHKPVRRWGLLPPHSLPPVPQGLRRAFSLRASRHRELR